MSHSELELAHGFDERRRLNVTYGASELQCVKRGGSMKSVGMDLIWMYVPQQCRRLAVHQFHLLGF